MHKFHYFRKPEVGCNQIRCVTLTHLLEIRDQKQVASVLVEALGEIYRQLTAGSLTSCIITRNRFDEVARILNLPG